MPMTLSTSALRAALLPAVARYACVRGNGGPRDLLHDDVVDFVARSVRLVTPVDELPDVLKVLCFFLELRDRS